MWQSYNPEENAVLKERWELAAFKVCTVICLIKYASRIANRKKILVEIQIFRKSSKFQGNFPYLNSGK